MANKTTGIENMVNHFSFRVVPVISLEGEGYDRLIPKLSCPSAERVGDNSYSSNILSPNALVPRQAFVKAKSTGIGCYHPFNL